ncbi:MAG: hypothetical protein R3A11_09970 [Bdellovibrionota bacterium]
MNKTLCACLLFIAMGAAPQTWSQQEPNDQPKSELGTLILKHLPIYQKKCTEFSQDGQWSLEEMELVETWATLSTQESDPTLHSRCEIFMISAALFEEMATHSTEDDRKLFWYHASLAWGGALSCVQMHGQSNMADNVLFDKLDARMKEKYGYSWSSNHVQLPQISLPGGTLQVRIAHALNITSAYAQY